MVLTKPPLTGWMNSIHSFSHFPLHPNLRPQPFQNVNDAPWPWNAFSTREQFPIFTMLEQSRAFRDPYMTLTLSEESSNSPLTAPRD